MRPSLITGLILLAAITGCKKVPQPTDGTTSPTFQADDRNTNYRPGAGALKNTVQAGKRTAAMHDYEQLKTIIFAMELENNRMPTKDEVRTELTSNGKNLLKLIDDGAIIMPSQLKKDGLWFYEVDAEKVGGIVVFQGNVSRTTAEDMKKYLGQ
jgi:predicted TIM-barrel enzyme